MAYLKHCLIFYSDLVRYRAGMEYVLYIINTVIGKIPIKRIPQFAMPVSPFFENLCPYIINTFFYLFKPI